MTTTVLLPEDFKDSTLGLLGKMNGDARDDLILSDGQPVRNRSSPEELFSFGASCKKSGEPQISAQNSLDVFICCEHMFLYELYTLQFVPYSKTV